MRAPLAAALERVGARLRAHGVECLLGGSALLDALCLEVDVGDLDLMVRPGDRDAFEAATAEWLVGVTTEPGPVMRSAWKATLDVDGVELEGLGGLAMAHEGRTVELPFRGSGRWAHGVELADPEIWWLVYRAYRPERAALLEPLLRDARCR